MPPTTDSPSSARPFYGWVVVGVLCVVMILVYGVRHSFSVFFPPILDEFDWRRGETAVMLSLHLLFYGACAPVVGAFTDRWHPRRILLIGVAVLSLATAACGLATSLWHFYLVFGLLTPIGLACCGSPVVNPTIVNWFSRNRGLALGVAQMGGGLSFIYAVFAEAVIGLVGWRVAYAVMGATLLLVLGPLVALLYRYHPREKGLVALGAGESASPVPVGSPRPVRPDWTLSEALGTRQLWLLMLSQMFFWGTGCYLVLAHQIKYTQDAGHGGLFAASILALYGACMVIGQLSAAVSDWVGREITVIVSACLCVAGVLALMTVAEHPDPWRLYAYAVCFGLGAGLQAPTIFAGAADLYYGKHFGAINGFVLAGMGVGGAFGPWLGGYLFDVTGTYRYAFMVSIGAFALSAVAFVLTSPRSGPVVKG